MAAVQPEVQWAGRTSLEARFRRPRSPVGQGPPGNFVAGKVAATVSAQPRADLSYTYRLTAIRDPPVAPLKSQGVTAIPFGQHPSPVLPAISGVTSCPGPASRCRASLHGHPTVPMALVGNRRGPVSSPTDGSAFSCTRHFASCPCPTTHLPFQYPTCPPDPTNLTPTPITFGTAATAAAVPCLVHLNTARDDPRLLGFVT